MPIMKLNNGHYSSSNETHGNLGSVACEAGEERWCSDPDLDRTKTKDNIYLTEYKSGLELEADINAEIDALSEEMKKTSKNHRGLRKDCIRAFGGIVKPDEEFMSQLSLEEQEQFFRDAFEVLNGYFGTNPKTNQPNIRMAVIHKDEGNMHLHYIGVPYNNEGRLCADDIFKPKLYKWLNEGFVDEMRQKGWNLEKCVKEQDLNSPYDDVKYKQLRKDAKTAKKELEKAIAGGDETEIATAQSVFDEKHRKYDEYKNICVSYKRNKRKEHGKTSKEFKEQQELEKGFKKGVEYGIEAVRKVSVKVFQEARQEAYKDAYKEASRVYDAEMEKQLKTAQNSLKNIVDEHVEDLTAFIDDTVEEYRKAVTAHQTAEQTSETEELKETLKNITFRDGRTGLDVHQNRMAKKAEMEKKRLSEAERQREQRIKEIQRLERLSETDGLTDQEQNRLDSLYKQKMMERATETLKQPEYTPYQQKMLDKINRQIQQQSKQRNMGRNIGWDIGD